MDVSMFETPGRFDSVFKGHLKPDEKGPCWISNVETELFWEELDGCAVPISRNHHEFESSYVVSPYSALILYSRQEMDKLPRVFKVINLIIYPLSLMLKSMQLNKAISVNNWLLSTNILPKVSDFRIIDLCRLMRKSFPDHFVFVRSLNKRCNRPLMNAFAKAGFHFIPSRQVYIFDFTEKNTRHNFLVDQKLLAKKDFVWSDAVNWSEADFKKAERLYGLLYLDKYSEYNPAFTSRYLQLCQATKTMQLFGLHGRQGEMLGVVGFFVREDIMTVPIVGYDTKKPSKLGLYRLLMAFSMKYAMDSKYLLNLSSGASSFKRLRGGIPYTEYSAVSLHGLSWYRKLGFMVLKFLLYSISLPLLKIFKL
jgi:hypothetical protein